MKKPNQPAAGLIRSLFVLLSILVWSANSKAQNSCSTAVQITAANNGATFQQTNENSWYSFTATTGIQQITIRNHYNNTFPGQVATVAVYSGNCSTLNLLEIQSAPFNPNNPLADTSIIIVIDSLQIGSQYYIKTILKNQDAADYSVTVSTTVLSPCANWDIQTPIYVAPGSSINNYFSLGWFGYFSGQNTFYMAAQVISGNLGITNLRIDWEACDGNFYTANNTISQTLTAGPLTCITGTTTFYLDGNVAANANVGEQLCIKVWVYDLLAQLICEKEFCIEVCADLANAGQDQTICRGECVTLTGENADSFVWYDGSTNQPLDTGLTFTVCPNQTTTYYVIPVSGFTCTAAKDYVTVFVTPVPNVLIVPDFSQICINAEFQLQAITQGTPDPWVWTCSNSSNVINCVTNDCGVISSQTTGTATYTATTYFQDIGCYGSASFTVNPVLPPTVNAGNDIDICLGHPVTLTGSASGVYDQTFWQTNVSPQLCTNCTTVTTTPTPGTQYAVFTVTSSQTECVATDTALINITQLPGVTLVPLLGSNANILCANVAYTVNGAPAGSTIVWTHTANANVSASQSAPNIYSVNWGQSNATTGTVQATVTAPDGCMALLQLPVSISCCSTISSETIIELNNQSSGYLLANIDSLCPNCVVNGNQITQPIAQTIFININGVFTIDAPLMLTGFSEIRMGTNASINIISGSALELRNCTTSTYCGVMWDGIYINGSSTTLKVNTNTMLQQARNAIVSVNGGRYVVSDTRFRDCVKGIWVKPFATAHSGTVQSSVFEMPGTFLPAVPALPASTTKTLAGIEIEQVNGLIVGNASQANFRNTFTGLFKGVFATASNSTILNAEFTNLVATNSVAMSGTAIHCQGLKNIPYLQSITVGGTSANMSCRVNNSRRGVVVNLAHNVNITGNSFTNFNNWFASPAVGIAVNNCQGRTIQIQNNRISNATAANRLPVGINVTDVNGSTVNILNNRLLQCNSAANNYAEQTGTGIVVQNTSSVPVFLNISNNDTISSFALGINLINITNAANNQALVVLNKVLFTKPKVNYFSQLHYGIGVTNCTQIKVDTNIVRRTSPVAWNTSDLPAQATNLRGVYITNSGGCIISDNTFSDLGEGVHANGTLPATYFVCNELLNSFRAFMFSGSTAGSALLNDQLTFQNNTYPTGNNFVGSINSDLAGSIRSVTNTLNGINWYYSGVMPSSGSLLFGSLANSTNTPVMSNNGSQCANGQFFVVSPVDERDKLAGTQIALSSDAQADELTKQMAAKDAHRLLLEHPDWLNLNTAQDGDYSDFYQLADSSEIGVTNHTEKAAVNDLDTLAITLNTDLSGSLELTEIHKVVFQIYNQTWLLDTVGISSQDTAVLLPIALMHPAQGGDAVYTARVMLGITVDDATGNYNYRMMQQTEVVNSVVDVYPNPADQIITITGFANETDIVLFTLFDLSGRKVIEKQLVTGNGTATVYVNELQQGAYLYQISVNGALTKSERLVITH
ncbi:MAG: T9SS type A sorting domain-containing protein [Bacteroidia bacterium]|jgi:hypothetical protein|nr:T9SS type A sorting domain-containing protein [Bacteroidia bacterium]